MANHEVMSPAFWVQLNLASFHATYEASGVELNVFFSTLVTKLRESVDDDTEEDVEQDDNDDYEEHHIKRSTNTVFLIIRIDLPNSLSNTSS